VEQLRRTLEEFPFQIPDGCIEIQNPKESMNYDLAIYELKGKLLDDVEGFSVEDIATDADIKEFKQQRSKIFDVVSWGYPMGIFTTISDNVTPQPCKGQITVWPNSTFPFVQTNLRINHGASGSFALTMQGKVIGVVIGIDSSNNNNTLCVPANFLGDMYQEILEHSN
jgi:S1-C subfamily serine protease